VFIALFVMVTRRHAVSQAAGFLMHPHTSAGRVPTERG
jgi:hydrogenase-4 membrane subunit HyfE